MRPDIFISYSHADKAFAAALARSLDKEWVVWWDEDLAYGERFEARILEKISTIPITLVVVSANSVASEWVRREIDAALKKAHVIPILKAQTDLPDGLRDLHRCDLTGWDGETETTALKQLHRDIRLALQAHVPVSARQALAGAIPDAHGSVDANTDQNAPNWFSANWLTLVVTGLVTWAGVHLAVEESPSDKQRRWSEQICAEDRCGQGSASRDADHAYHTRHAWIAIKREAEYVSDNKGSRKAFVCHQREIVQRHAKGENVDLKLLFPFLGCPDPLLALIAYRHWGDLLASHRGQATDACENRNDVTLAKIFGTSPPPPAPLAATLNDILAFDLIDELDRRQCLSELGWKTNQPEISLRSLDIVPVHLTADTEGSPHSGWSRMIGEGRVADARQFLESMPQRNASEDILLARMYDRGIGGPVRMTEAVRLLKDTALKHNSNAARFNLGLSYVFGHGVPSDVYLGTKLIDDALMRGFAPEAASQALQKGCCDVTMERFPEVQKRLNLLAQNGDAAAKTLKAVYAVHGLSIPPCSMDCLKIARELGAELRQSGHVQFALTVEQVIEAKHPKAAEVSGLRSQLGPRAIERGVRAAREIPASIERTVLNQSRAYAKPWPWTRLVPIRK